MAPITKPQRSTELRNDMERDADEPGLDVSVQSHMKGLQGGFGV